jgi:hypothetical protein
MNPDGDGGKNLTPGAPSMTFAGPAPPLLPEAFGCPICWTGANPFAIWLTKRIGKRISRPLPRRRSTHADEKADG